MFPDIRQEITIGFKNVFTVKLNIDAINRPFPRKVSLKRKKLNIIDLRWRVVKLSFLFLIVYRCRMLCMPSLREYKWGLSEK